jgi:hypothetical protein
MKLSKTQQEIVDRLNNGWELGAMSDMSGRCWIQKPGLGRGGESHNVSSATIHALVKKGVLVYGEYKYPWREIHLVEK